MLDSLRKIYNEKLSEEEQLDIIYKYPVLIAHIKNPSEKLQLASINDHNGYHLAYIKKPTQFVIMEALKQDPHNILYVDNPSEKIQYMAVSQNEFSISVIKNPTVGVQLLAVKKNPYVISEIHNPCIEVLKFLDIIKNSIEFIKE